MDMKAWERGLKPVNKIRAELPLATAVKDAGGEAVLGALTRGDLLQNLLQKFTNEQFMGLLKKEYSERADAGEEYWPHYLSKYYSFERNLPVITGDGTQESGSVDDDLQTEFGAAYGRDSPITKRVVRVERERVNMSRGFSALWNAIAAAPQVSKTSTGGVVAHIGNMNSIMGLKLTEYMGQQGWQTTNSPLNSLFKAIEFGTGVAENVGAGFVRTEGDSKDRSGQYPAGSWWFYNPKDEDAANKYLREKTGSSEIGALFTGQKGFHFLTDARRQPREIYRKYFIDKFPLIIRKALRDLQNSTP